MGHEGGQALVVEDDQSWQQILTEILADMGFAVDVCEDAAHALANLQTSSYRLAVVDLSLAGSDHHNQDGIEVLETIRGHAAGCVAVLLSGFASAELSEDVLRRGLARACLHKEAFRRSDFRQVVSSVLA